MVRAAPFRNPTIAFVAFLALIELNLAVAVVLQERRVSEGDYSNTNAFLAFCGFFTFALAPLQFIASRIWLDGKIATVSWDCLWTSLMLVFHFAGAAALTTTVNLQPSHEPFVARGAIGLLALAWTMTILLSFLFFTTVTFFIRRWAAWEDGVSKMPTATMWEEGWWGGGLVKKSAQDEWRRKKLVERERRERGLEAIEEEEEEEAETKGKGKGKGAMSRRSEGEVVVIVLPPTESTDEGFGQYSGTR